MTSSANIDFIISHCNSRHVLLCQPKIMGMNTVGLKRFYRTNVDQSLHIPLQRGINFYLRVKKTDWRKFSKLPPGLSYEEKLKLLTLDTVNAYIFLAEHDPL